MQVYVDLAEKAPLLDSTQTVCDRSQYMIATALLATAESLVTGMARNKYQWGDPISIRCDGQQIIYTLP